MQHKVCFSISQETDTKVKALPRNFNMSERLREAVEVILKENEINPRNK